MQSIADVASGSVHLGLRWFTGAHPVWVSPHLACS